MPIFLLKSFLSVVVLCLTLLAMFTMFEVFGRGDKKYNIETLKKIHRINGIVYLLFFIFIAYLCLDFIVRTRAEPSPRAAFHAVFSMAVIVLLSVKISFVRFYRQFYGKVQTIGIIIALTTFGMIGTSAGYYLLVTKFGTEKMPETVFKKVVTGKIDIMVKADNESINNGKELYESKCYFCHDPLSNKTIVGPGHKGILKNPLLPVSRRPATPENVAIQLKNPFKDMPSFSYLSDDQVQEIIAFLNTL
ncbi:MAG: cytochrome c [Nitrospirae bacterium]|nr:cytochrome c [Nitrospirota bacterium]